MIVTGTHFNYYLVCKRKLWLFSHGVNMEQNSDLVYEGKLIHESSYPQRSSKYEEVAIDGIRVDYYDAKNKVIHEIKKSNKIEEAHEWQLKFYMYVFEEHGIEGVSGMLEYPALRKTRKICLSDADRDKIREIMAAISVIINQESCPALCKKNICRNCSYYEFCYTREDMP
jgi:CRISPR-associated exonuclease Cas4